MSSNILTSDFIPISNVEALLKTTHSTSFHCVLCNSQLNINSCKKHLNNIIHTYYIAKTIACCCNRNPLSYEVHYLIDRKINSSKLFSISEVGCTFYNNNLVVSTFPMHKTNTVDIGFVSIEGNKTYKYVCVSTDYFTNFISYFKKNNEHKFISNLEMLK